MTAPKFRPLTFGVTRVVVRDGAPGVRYVKAEQPLQDHPPRLTDRLQHWAQTAPERTFMARRVKQADGSSGDWRHISYLEAWASARAIAQGLINRGLSAERPVVILSENDLEHALLALGCLVAGVPFVPTSPPYSLISTDFSKLRHVLDTVTPGLVFAADGARYGKAIQVAVGADIEVVLTAGALPGRASTAFAELLATPVTPAVDAAMQATGPDTIAKFLFTSGSTKLPKAVINTQGMWCANQQQMAQSMPVLTEAPPVLVDWLPWNHTFGGNHNFGMVVYHGGTMYIDDGKPTPALIGETLRNLREVAPTVYFNVPTGFEAIASAMKTDAALRKTFLSRVRMFFYAGAALAQPVWDSLYESEEARDRRAHRDDLGAGHDRIRPLRPVRHQPQRARWRPGRAHARAGTQAGGHGRQVRGALPRPQHHAGLLALAGRDRRAFRRRRFLLFGRRAQVDRRERPAPGPEVRRPHCRGLQARHRHLRQRRPAARQDHRRGGALHPGRGHHRPEHARGRRHGVPQRHGLPRPGRPARRTRPVEQVLASPGVHARFQGMLDKMSESATGSANRIARLCLLSEPPTIDRGEITDKGSINQRAVLAHRAAIVDALHADTLPGMLKPAAH